jgi:ribose-phosphate pyrophosphokinase
VIPVLPGSTLKLIAGDAHPALAAKIAEELKVPLEPVEAGTFADGESHIHIGGDVRNATVVIVQPTSPPVNDRLMTLALLVDAARAAGAARTIGVVPYFGYSRQEQRGDVGDPRSARVVAQLLGAVGVDHLVTLDLHAPALESALPMPATLLRPDDLFVPLIQSWNEVNLAIVAPDAGGMKRAQRFATRLNAELVVVAKTRPRHDVATPLSVLGDAKGRTCVIIDDMASTGRTLAGAAERLHEAGAKSIHAVFTHPVMASGAIERLCAAPVQRLVTSDCVAMLPHPRIQVVSTASLLAQAIRRIVGENW